MATTAKTDSAESTTAKKSAAKTSAKKASAPKKATAKSAGGIYDFSKNMQIFSRAVKVVPQGIYGHQSPALTIPGEFPFYAANGKGVRYTDVDGNEFIDYMCAYGPMILGYANDEVNAAAVEAMELGDCFNHPSELMVQLAERMVDSVPHADWAVFGKNGSDMTTWATMVAREHTDRRKIVMVKGTYHGIHSWCTPGHGGLIPADRENMLYFDWNRLDQLEELFRRQGDDIAGVIMTPYHHPAMAGSIMPADGFWKGVQKVCNDNGALLILDDVRCGWRLSFHGSQDYFGFEPDLSCYCKAIGNGFPISAAVGREEIKTSASRVFLTGSYWNGAMCMNAALKTLEILEREKAVDHMFAMGERLNKGLEELGEKYGYPMKMTGPATMGYLVLDDDPDLFKIQRFCAEVTKRGSFFHPHHNWFISAAHTASDIDETLGHSEDALKAFG